MFSFQGETLQHIHQERELKMDDIQKDKGILVQNCARCHTVEKRARHKTGLSLQCLLERKTGQAQDSLTQISTRTEASLRNW